MSAPIALSCGEPAGIGPEIAAAAWDRLRDALPFFLIGDPAHLPSGTPVVRITDPTNAQSMGLVPGTAPVNDDHGLLWRDVKVMNDHAYIVPGLGDAGDRLYGTV